MNGNINTRSMIFTLYGDYIRHYGNEVWIGSLIRLLKEFGHNEQSVRAAISRMNKQGWVSALKRGNKSYYFLTERGIDRMDEAAKRIFKLKPDKWDGEWRMLIYAIPEEKRNVRDELRQELTWSGFGTISNSCYLSPNDLMKEVYTLIDKYEIREYVHLFHTTYEGPQENQRLVNECWDLTSINERYQQFITQYSEKYEMVKHNIALGKVTDAECFVERTQLVHEYRKFLFIDPGLPEELLPEKWLGSQAASLFSDFYKQLAGPASKFFEEVFQDGNPLISKNKEYDMLQHPLLLNE